MKSTDRRPARSAEEEREMLAALSGTLEPEAQRRFERRMATEPDVRLEFERWRAAWNGVGDPPEVRLPWEFGRGLAARAFAERSERDLLGDWRGAPSWARVSAAAALVCGIAFGWTLAPTPTPIAGGAAAAPVAVQSVAEPTPEPFDPADPADPVDQVDLGNDFGDSSLSLWEALASADDEAGSS